MSILCEQVKELRYKADIYNTVGSAWELNRAEAKILQGLLRKAANTIESLSAKLEDMERPVEDCDGWILCSDKMPENGETVEITYVWEPYGKKGKTCYGTARAFYTDGTMTTEDSGFYWEDEENWEYCAEEDVTYIPAGWWESVAFSETFSAVNNKVIAWRPISGPYNPQKSIGDDYKKQIMDKFLRVE